MTSNIIEHFDEYFEMIPAVSDELKIEVYKLRYAVFCSESKIFNSEKYPNNLEFDDYDQQSIHYLIRHRKSGNYAATTRLILPHANNPEKLFPVETYSQIDNVNLLKTISRNNLAELSRFCVSKEFRKRKSEQQLLTTSDANSEVSFVKEEKRNSSHLTLSLFACAIKMSHENNIHYWYAFMEPAMIRVMSNLGIHFIKIGPLLNYHGIRCPCIIKVDDLLDSVAEKNTDYWEMLTRKGTIWQAKINEKRANYTEAQQS